MDRRISKKNILHEKLRHHNYIDEKKKRKNNNDKTIVHINGEVKERMWREHRGREHKGMNSPFNGIIRESRTIDEF